MESDVFRGDVSQKSLGTTALPTPSRCLYNLSQPERKAIEICIWDSLAAGIMYSSSSAGSRVFLCGKEAALH